MAGLVELLGRVFVVLVSISQIVVVAHKSIINSCGLKHCSLSCRCVTRRHFWSIYRILARMEVV